MEELQKVISELTCYIKKSNSQLSQLTQDKWLFQSLEDIKNKLDEIKISISNTKNVN